MVRAIVQSPPDDSLPRKMLPQCYGATDGSLLIPTAYTGGA